MEVVTAGAFGMGIATVGYACYRYWKSNPSDEMIVELMNRSFSKINRSYSHMTRLHSQLNRS